MNANQSASELPGDSRIGACICLLHGLLQRLDQKQPGLIDEKTESVVFDLSAIDPSNSPSPAHGALVAEEHCGCCDSWLSNGSSPAR